MPCPDGSKLCTGLIANVACSNSFENSNTPDEGNGNMRGVATKPFPQLTQRQLPSATGKR